MKFIQRRLKAVLLTDFLHIIRYIHLKLHPETFTNTENNRKFGLKLLAAKGSTSEFKTTGKHKKTLMAVPSTTIFNS